MIKNRGLGFRILADILVACAALGAVVGASRSPNGAWLVVILGGLLLAAVLAGYREPFARRVWIHPLVIMSPVLIALPVALLTCRGFECGGIIGFLMAASLFTLVLLGGAFVAFYVGRRITRPDGA